MLIASLSRRSRSNRRRRCRVLIKSAVVQPMAALPFYAALALLHTMVVVSANSAVSLSSTLGSTDTPLAGDPTTAASQPTFDATAPYCDAELCELYNGTHLEQVPHIACGNAGHFAPQCGTQPRLIEMNERRRDLILDLHNLARSRIASGRLQGYAAASHMPLLKWDDELAELAALHAKRCEFAHDRCRNTDRFRFSGQNIGYYWIERDFKSHTKRMKSFIVSWFREHIIADQSYIDSYRPQPEGKMIGHFTLMVADRVHRVGCAAIRFQTPSEPTFSRFLMTCNYDFTNILGEPIYQSGPTASRCALSESREFPGLCEWREAAYDYDSAESSEGESTTVESSDTD